MNKILSAFQDKLSSAKEQLSDLIGKERTLYVSDKLINDAINADEKFTGKLSEKGLTQVHFQAEQDQLIVTGMLNKDSKEVEFKVELRPDKIVWTKDEQAIFLKLLDYDLKMQQGGYLDLIKLTLVKMMMSVFGHEMVLKKTDIKVQDGLIIIDLNEVDDKYRRIMQSIELNSIQCLDGKIAITIKPREDMAKENVSLLKNWLAHLKQ